MNCLNLVKAEIEKNTSVADKAYMVIENCIIGLCDYKRAYDVISFADEISQTRNYDWDSLQETLYLYSTGVAEVIHEREQEDEFVALEDVDWDTL